MDQVEPSHEEGEEEREVIFREDDLQPVETTPPTPITSNDMDVIIRGWEIKFEQMSRCLREVQLASEKANSDMFDISREGRARGNEQERRLEAMHVGLTEFLQKCEPAHSQLRATSMLPRWARRTRSRRPQGYQPDCVRNLNSNHLQWARTSPWNPRAARYRTSGITTTSGVRAPGITTTFGTRASENTTPSGTRAPENTSTIGTRAPETSTIVGQLVQNSNFGAPKFGFSARQKLNQSYGSFCIATKFPNYYFSGSKWYICRAIIMIIEYLNIPNIPPIIHDLFLRDKINANNIWSFVARPI